MAQLRPFQQAALDVLKNPGHLLCVAPTGSGKSLIYERASLTKGRRTLLITPLVALARQQRTSLSKSALLAVRLGAGQPSEGPPTVSQGSGVWIISPENLLIPSRIGKLTAWRPDFLVVDECHCLWEWGDGFRPAFNQIPELIKKYSIPRSLWLTATLPLEARLQLREALPGPLHEQGAFDLPPSLHLSIVRVSLAERPSLLLSWLSQQQGPGILFVPARESAERLARLITATGRTTVFYHAGMSAEERRAVESKIAEQLPDVIVATSAFGMGMDYPKLQWTVLWQAPSSLLALAQTIGRVGRGSAEKAAAAVFWDDDDFRMLEWMLQGVERRTQQLKLTHQYLGLKGCRRQGLRQYFATGKIEETEFTATLCGLCDFCAASTAASSFGQF